MRKWDWLRTVLILAAALVLTHLLKALGVGRESLLMVYIVGVLCCAAFTHGYFYSLLGAVVSMLMFNYFDTQPLHTFAISSKDDYTLLAFFLIAAFIAATLTARFREALLQSQENEHRAEQLFKEKEGARLEAEQAKMRSDLLRSIGHDLRTPLTGIQCGANYLAEHGDTLPPAEIKKFAGDISEEVAWLSNLVENILYMTRIGDVGLQLQKQPEVVDDVVSEAVAHVPALAGRALTVLLPEQVLAVPMDGRMIVQVLVNLLDNAVRYTGAGCPVRLSVCAEGARAVFVVEDGGPGIPPDQCEQIFSSFATSGKIGPDGRRGVGLGLTICRAVVCAHGGAIAAGSSALGGAKFSFWLPLEEPMEENNHE